ncbi:Hypothetical predicted protein [Paramuricea clavata]|uniref:Uncharacterized protein n=1 Tax=Paramuricea clavata TaxID=317549 RepID=A0A6S7JB33_PARCT|nr:Hypothetical predicted protein [Paramuricea clavata]
MAGYEGSGSPTPSEQEDNDDKDEDNITEHEEEAQEDDDTQADETMNDGEPNESSAQDNYTNPGNEADGAQGLPESEDAEMAQPTHVGSDSDIMAHDPDAGLDLEEELGGMIIAVLDYDNGQMELLVISIDSPPTTPEL